MRKYLLMFFPALVIWGFVFALPPSGKVDDLKPNQVLINKARIITGLIDFNHYTKRKLNDSISSIFFENYLNALDYNRLYLLQEDIDRFEAYRFQLDEDLRDGTLEPAYDIFNTFRSRFIARMDTVEEMVAQEFDFTKDEYYETERHSLPYAKNRDELDEIWRKYLKSQILNLKVNGKEREAINELLLGRFERYTKTITQYNSEDVFQIYMNAFTEAYDPHTAYLSPISSDNFKIRMSKSLEGIGATLRMENDYTTVSRVTPGGPAFKSKVLKENDRIVGVAQEDKEMIDVVGWRLDDVIQLIRGNKGTKVRLEILPAEANLGDPTIELPLIRDVIKLEEQSANKEIFSFKEGEKMHKMGIINIPAFYMDFDGQRRGDDDYKSTSRDVRRLLGELKEEEVEGVIIDLRDNGGGALLEAIELAGLFIPDGPMVQVRNTDGSVDLGEDPDPEQVYNGPLLVLVNRFSASASEIFAGAIQDYRRGVVIGESTYGKGTVQNVIDLGNFLRDQESDNQGQLNLTLAKYYRVTGSSTQHVGVTPDIPLPSPYDAQEFGESSQPSALPWDEIKAADFKSLGNVSNKLLDQLYASYLKRLEMDTEMQEFIKEVEEVKTSEGDHRITLNESKLRKEREEENERQNARMRLSGGSLENPETGREVDEGLPKDPYLRTGIQILSDLIKASIG